MELKDKKSNNGKYFFTIGSFEVGGFRNSNLKDSKYIGRFKTKNKELAFLGMLSVNLMNKKLLKYEIDFAFFDKYGDFIIGDVFFIEDNNIENKLDKLSNLSSNYLIKENIIVINLENNEELECFTYFKNFNDFEEIIKKYKDVVNEYTIDEKIKAMETIIKLDTLKGKDNSMSEFFIKLQELKEKGQDMNKLLE